ncbi:MAG: hydrogenase [Candidatus Hydrogenedentes bacterium]|nr:hydrogenase [Candidatus Hydrogenedentota bacterium]
MTYHPAIDTILVLAMLLNLSMLASSRLATCIRLFAFQSFLLALLPVGGEIAVGELPSLHAYLIAAAAIGLKVILIPYVLMRILRSGEIHKDVEPFIGFTASVMIGALAIVASFAMASRLVLPMPPFSDLVLPAALSTIFIGLLTLVTRVTAITQVIGYLVLENGIFIFGLFLLNRTPLLVELGILLDVFVGVFIMAIVVYHIRREFDHIDTDLLDELKEV